MRSTIKIISLILFTSFLSSCSIHLGAHSKSGDIDSIFGGIDVDSHSEVGDLSSVNGGIEVEDNAKTGSIDTVNGGIDIGDNVQIQSAETVNGSIEIGKNITTKADLETVNGSIIVQKKGYIGGTIKTVNGDIKLNEVTVEEDIKTTNGDIYLLEGSMVKADIVFEDSNSWFSNSSSNMPELTIDESSTVKGIIHLHRKVKLKIADGATIGGIEYHYKRQ